MLALTALAAFPAMLHATSCSIPPPCGRIRPGTVIFVGLVVAADPADDKDDSMRPARLQVQEVFQGLPPGTEEVVVFTQGSWLKKGFTYLVDAHKRSDGLLEPVLCGATDEIESTYARDLLEYLRKRQAGQVETSLSASVRDDTKSVPDADVTIVGSKKSLTAKTDHNGMALFKDIEPGPYRVRASKEFYRPDPKRDNEEILEVLYGSCEHAFLGLQAQGEVWGLVRDEKGTPVSGLPMELLEIDEPSHRSDGWYHSKTDDQGNFRFESVSPGRYYLGTNLLEYSKTAPIPRIFYAGRREPAGAIPVEVKLGEALDNLSFTIPYFGKPREIRFLVINEKGEPVKGARLINKSDEEESDLGALGTELRSDGKGALVAMGFEGVRYRVGASIRGNDIRDLYMSDYVDIPPGPAPPQTVLMVKSLLNLAKPVKP